MIKLTYSILLKTIEDYYTNKTQQRGKDLQIPQ